MKRLVSEPRPDWKAKVEKVGLTYHTHEEDGVKKPYWNEAACYELTADEVDELEKAVHDLHYLLIDVADEVVTKGRWEELAISQHAVPLIERSWQADDFSVYGRFDFAWPTAGAPKLLEYNADTPTGLVEAAVSQWYWLEDLHPKLDQFNSIHERLIAAWKRYASLQPGLQVIDFTSMPDNLEDEQTISYLMDTAKQGGFETRWSAINEIGYDSRNHVFVSGPRLFHRSEPIVSCFKLYPLECMMREAFGQQMVDAPTFWIEPPWKALLSNKAILALAWEKHAGHPNLLPCYFDATRLSGDYVRKPKLGREGANVQVVRGGKILAETGGEYGDNGYVYQAVADIPSFDGNRPVLGGWVVDHEPAGLGIRESDGPITDNLSRFVPHYFVPR